MVAMKFQSLVTVRTLTHATVQTQTPLTQRTDKFYSTQRDAPSWKMFAYTYLSLSRSLFVGASPSQLS